ncbi:MAG: hypothetical protein WAV30_03250 [Microgenomates group bacterium]
MYIKRYAPYYLLGVATLFLVSSTRSLFINEVFVEWVLFLSIMIGMVGSYKVRAIWISFYFYILMLFYNPFFLVFHDMPYTYLADISIAVTFFFLALRWESFAFEKPM